MSIEITFHPKASDKRRLKALLEEIGFESAKHVSDRTKGSLHFRWFTDVEYQSYDGVEATIFAPNEALETGSPQCAWALHTRTRASASPADRKQQNLVVRTARARFGGAFYNDSAGKNRYTKVEDDGRDAASRGIYLAYESVGDSLKAVQFALPDPTPAFERLVGTDLDALSEVDPRRVFYNALVPFAVAAVEHFLSRSFKVLLEFDPKTRERLLWLTRKVEMGDVISIVEGEMSVEDVVVGWYSFQSLDSIQKAFGEWFGIDFRATLRVRRRIGRRVVTLESEFGRMIEARHGLIHRLQIDSGLRKHDISELLDAAMAVIDAFVDHLESQRSMRVRGRASGSNPYATRLPSPASRCPQPLSC